MRDPGPFGRVDNVSFLLGLVGGWRRQQEQVVAAGHGRIQRVGPLEVAQGGLQAQALDRGCLVGRVDQGPSGHTLLGEQPHQLRADLAGGTGDQDHDRALVVVSAPALVVPATREVKASTSPLASSTGSR